MEQFGFESDPLGTNNDSNIVSGAVPSTKNVVRGDDCVRCCNAGKLSFELQVYRIVGELVNALGDQINFMNDKRILGLTETMPIVGFVEPKAGGVVTIEEYKIRWIKPNEQIPRSPGIQPTFFAAGQTLIAAAQAIDQVSAQIGILTQVQEALQRISTTSKKSSTKDCEECCKKRLLSQKNPRKIVTKQIRERIAS